MRTKRHTFFRDLAKLVQAENLEAPRISKDRPRPRHETMQPAHLPDGCHSGTQVEVISIAEKNLNSEFFENVLRHALDGRYRAYRHEYRGFDLAMRGEHSPAASGAGASLDMELNRHSGLCLAIVATPEQ